MAAEKEKTKKKVTPKKKVTNKKKATEKKVVKPVEEKVLNEVVETEEKKENLEVVNGDPAVLEPVEEAAPIEEKEDKEKVVEEKETGVKKIIKKINRSIGYFWNGQMIDF